MTLNQIAYWSLKESERHNLASEEAQMMSARAAMAGAGAANRQAAVAEKNYALNQWMSQFDAELKHANAINLYSQASEREQLLPSKISVNISQASKNMAGNILGVTIPGMLNVDFAQGSGYDRVTGNLASENGVWNYVSNPNKFIYKGE